jgi:hypothetical protein
MTRLFFIIPSLLMTAFQASSCRDEMLFGPIVVNVPSEIHERSASRLFRLPICGSAVSSYESLQNCLASTKPRQVACQCDHLVFGIDDQEVIIDYKLTLLAGSTADVRVWVGVLRPTPQNELLDLPYVETVESHVHHLLGEQEINYSFTEKEMRNADKKLAKHIYECGAAMDVQPGALEWLWGVSLLDGSQSARVRLESTFSVLGGCS